LKTRVDSLHFGNFFQILRNMSTGSGWDWAARLPFLRVAGLVQATARLAVGRVFSAIRRRDFSTGESK
jgi:hypothetical protein